MGGYVIEKQLVKERMLSDSNDGILPLTNTLDFFGVKNVVAKVPKESLEKLPNQFLAQISNGKQFNIVLVDKTNDDKIVMYADENKTAEITMNEFLQNWTGLVIAIEENKNSTKKYDKTIYFKIGVLLTAIFLLLYVVFSTNSLYKTFYTLTTIVGVFLSYLIVKQKYSEDGNSKFCQLSKNTDCNSVIGSKQAVVFKNLDLIDICVVYFSFQLVTFPVTSGSLLYFIFGVIALPIVAYSVYQQYYTIKKWCPLCLGIASVLVFQFSTLFSINNQLYLDYKSVLYQLFFFCTITLIWQAVKPLLIINEENKELRIENLTFRRNHKLFIPFYASLPEVDHTLNSYYRLRLGAKTPKIILTTVTNLFCKYCAEVHHSYIDLLHKYPNELGIDICFYVSNTDKNNPHNKIATTLIQIYKEKGEQEFLKAIANWHKKPKMQSWLSQYKLKEDKNSYELLKSHINFCAINTISLTPTLLVNNKFFPRTYKIEDIAHFIEPILEFEKENDTVYA